MMYRHALPPHWCRSGLVLAATLSAGLPALPGWAQMADPTRPTYAGSGHAGSASLNPAANQPQARAYVSPNLPLPGREAGPVMGPGEGRAGPAIAAPGTPRLSSVMVGPAHVASAVIDGQVIRLGERIRGDTLVSVDRTGVLLKGAQGSTRLNLLSRTAMPAAAPLASAAPEPVAPKPVATSPADTLGVARKEMP